MLNFGEDGKAHMLHPCGQTRMAVPSAASLRVRSDSSYPVVWSGRLKNLGWESSSFAEALVAEIEEGTSYQKMAKPSLKTQ